MKKWVIVLAALLLSGCASEPVFETVDDLYTPLPVAAAKEIDIQLPENAALAVMENEETGTLYFCDGFTVAVQTMESGDLEKTLRTVTGYGQEALTLLQTTQGKYDRWECVWSSAGEGTDQVGRLCLLDDGSWHYVLTFMADASSAGTLTDDWQAIVDSFAVY